MTKNLIYEVVWAADLIINFSFDRPVYIESNCKNNDFKNSLEI